MLPFSKIPTSNTLEFICFLITFLLDVKEKGDSWLGIKRTFGNQKNTGTLRIIP